MTPDEVVNALDGEKEYKHADYLAGNNSLVEGVTLDSIRAVVKGIAHNYLNLSF